MGYTTEQVTVHVMLSRHNSPTDDVHDQLWADLRQRLAQVCDDPKYRPIAVLTSGLDDIDGDEN